MRELTKLELARDAVSWAATDWIAAAAEGGEDTAISAFDEALKEFERAAREDAIRDLTETFDECREAGEPDLQTVLRRWPPPSRVIQP